MADRIDVNRGDQYGRLTIIEQVASVNGSRRFLCVCVCGKQKAFPLIALRAGRSKSCGCLQKEMARKANSTHRQPKDRLYNIWANMKGRCFNPLDPAFKNYGGRGISVSSDWHDFLPFKEWAIQNGYDKSLSIERKDNNGNYCPGNCKWATRAEQARNTRSNVIIEFGGRRMCLTDWSTELGVERHKLKKIINEQGVEPAIANLIKYGT